MCKWTNISVQRDAFIEWVCHLCCWRWWIYNIYYQETVISMWALHNQNAACMFLLQLFYGWEAVWNINDGLPILAKSGSCSDVNVAGLTLTLLSRQLWSWTQRLGRGKGVETERKTMVRYNDSFSRNKDGVHQATSYTFWYEMINVTLNSFTSIFHPLNTAPVSHCSVLPYLILNQLPLTSNLTAISK